MIIEVNVKKKKKDNSNFKKSKEAVHYKNIIN